MQWQELSDLFFEEGSKIYPQVFLGNALYEL